MEPTRGAQKRSRPPCPPGVARDELRPLLPAPVSSKWRSEGSAQVEGGGSSVQPGSRSDRVVQYPAARSAVSSRSSAVHRSLRRVRVPRALAFPVAEGAGRILRSLTSSLQYRAESVPSSCQPRPLMLRPPSRPVRVSRSRPPSVPLRSAPSARATTTAPRSWPRRPRSRSPCGASGRSREPRPGG